LNVTSNVDIYKYQWKGPGGFTSSEFNPVVAHANTNLSGVYTLIAVTKDGCMYSINSDSVIVADPVVPCSLTDNTFKTESSSPVVFTNLSEDVGDLTYTIGVSDNQGSVVTMEFASKRSKVVAGIYNTSNNQGGDLANGDVHILVYIYGYKYNVPDGSNVYVVIENGQPVASFCNLPCYMPELYKTVNASVRIIAK
jgi:hypothetical protein